MAQRKGIAAHALLGRQAGAEQAVEERCRRGRHARRQGHTGVARACRRSRRIGGDAGIRRAGDGVLGAAAHHVGEFVREQPAPRVGPGLVAPGCEDDVITEGKGARRQRSRHHCLARAVMDPHRAEVATESRLEEIARGRVERLA